MRPPSYLVLFVTLACLSGTLRFCRLGDWPFHGDELATLDETASLFAGDSDDSPTSRLPRLIPLGYLVQKLSYDIFGDDEFGSRVGTAVISSLTPPLLFLLLSRPLGRRTAFLAGLLLALSPEQVQFGQEARFYATAFLAVSLSVAAGTRAAESRSAGWAALASLLGLLSILTHSVAVVVPSVLLVATALAAPRRRRVLLPAALGCAAALLIYLGHVRPLLGTWNSAATWGYQPAHALAASVFRLGWPFAVLVGFGAAVAISRRDEQDRYWLAWAAGWAISCLALPLVLPYRPAYSFPFGLGLYALAGRGVATLIEAMAESRPLAGWAWAAAACSLNLPALASHYADGSRADYRTAARFIDAGLRPGDRVVAVSPDLLRHYSSAGLEPLGLDFHDAAGAIDSLRSERDSPGRVWVALSYGRAIRPDPVLVWLRRNGSHELHVCRLRLDYSEFTTEVFLLTHGPPEGGRTAAR